MAPKSQARKRSCTAGWRSAEGGAAGLGGAGHGGGCPLLPGRGLGAGAGLDGLGDDGDVGDAGLLDGVHDGGEGAEGDFLVGAEIDDALGGVGAGGGAQGAGEVGEVDGAVLAAVLGADLEEDVLVLVDGDDGALFGELGDGFGVRDSDVDAGLEDGRGEHEDEQKDEDDVDERGDVDLGERGLGVGAPFTAGGEGHRLEVPPLDGDGSSGGCGLGVSRAAFSMALRSSRPKSSMRAAKSRSWAVSWL